MAREETSTIYLVTRRRLVAGDIDKSVLSVDSISINHYNDPECSRDKDPNTSAALASRCSPSFGYLPRPWVTAHYQAFICLRKVSNTVSTLSLSLSLSPPPLSRSLSRCRPKQRRREGCRRRTLVLEPAYLPLTRLHLIHLSRMPTDNLLPKRPPSQPPFSQGWGGRREGAGWRGNPRSPRNSFLSLILPYASKRGRILRYTRSK